MTREELIEHWATDVVHAVFAAEDKLSPQLRVMLEQHKTDKDKGAELYCRMIAEEIVSKLTDEQIADL